MLDIYLNKDIQILGRMTRYSLIATSETIKPDKKIKEKLAVYRRMLPKTVVVGRIEGVVDLRESTLRMGESEFANTINDILKEQFDVDAVFNNSGLFRGVGFIKEL